MARGDEVSDYESYRVGKRRGIGEALEAARYLGYTIGKQEAEDEQNAVEHDLQEVDTTVPVVVGRSAVGEIWAPLPMRMFRCKRCGTLCNHESVFEDIACDDDEREVAVDAAAIGEGSDTC